MRAWLVIGALALALVAPAAFMPPMVHDSFWIDWTWADQFTEQIRRGVVYPRMLPDANNGAGSATFYFYPPLAFYVTAILGLVGVPTYPAIIATFGLAAFGGGVAAYHWLKAWAPYPLFGAAFFTVGPYHVVDFYARGSLAESCAMALLPLVAPALHRRSFTLLAFVYAALILTHVPLALLTSVLLIGPYLIRHPRLIGAVALGAGLSAVYLLPALALDGYRDSSFLFDHEFFKPSNWTLFNRDPLFLIGGWAVFMATIGAIALPSLIILIRWRSAWAGYALALSALAAGLVPFFWSLPIIEKVQFPIRVLPLAELALAAAIASAGWLALVAATVPALGVLAADFTQPKAGTFPTIAELRVTREDVPENRLTRPLPVPNVPARLGALISLFSLLILVTRSGAALARQRRADRTLSS